MDRTTIPPAESRGEILTSATPRPASAARVSPWLPCAAAGVITLTALAAYCNSFQGPFIFDDASITDNPAIRSLRSLDTILLPAVNKSAVDRRPVVNLSLAINYAVGGTAVWGYHVFNLAAHILAAWTLLGVVRRTLLSPRLAIRWELLHSPWP